jgi:hypothetical protein
VAAGEQFGELADAVGQGLQVRAEVEQVLQVVALGVGQVPRPGS